MCVYIIYVYAHPSSASRPPTGRTIHTSPHSHSRTVRPLENFIRLAEGCRSYTTPTYENVTITWYRLSRSKVYSFLTLLTFLTPLNQERWSSATYSCRHFLHRKIKNDGLSVSYIVHIFGFLAPESRVSVPYSCHTMFTHINGYLNRVEK